MEKSILKDWLKEKKPGVYAVIVDTYLDQAMNLKPSLYLDWLARELEVPVDQISRAAIGSAVKRYRAKKAKLKVVKKTSNSDTNFKTEIPEFPGFK